MSSHLINELTVSKHSVNAVHITVLASLCYNNNTYEHIVQEIRTYANKSNTQRNLSTAS